MGERHTRQTPVRLFFALMAPPGEVWDRCAATLVREFGRIDCRSESWDFDAVSRYYADEFGPGLKKEIVSVEPLIAPERLVEIKIRTNELERVFAAPGAGASDGSPRRRINIDPGYLSRSRVVLATTKDYAHRLYMGRGIFEEVTLNYHRESDTFAPKPWTYADYRTEKSLGFFNSLRNRYCRQIKT